MNNDKNDTIILKEKGKKRKKYFGFYSNEYKLYNPFFIYTSNINFKYLFDYLQ